MDTEKPTEKSTGNAATVIIGQKVRAGSEEAFEAWQQDMNSAASHYPGFLGARSRHPPPCNPTGSWSTASIPWPTCRPGSTAPPGSTGWTRGSSTSTAPPPSKSSAGGTRESDPLVTVVVTHRVGPEHVDDFLAWQDRLRLEESKFDGFRGSELFRPIEGVQDEWTALYRYDNAADLDRWLTSAKRQELLAEGGEVPRLRIAHHRQLLRELVRVRRERQRGAAAVRNQDVDRGVGRSVSHRRGSHPRVVAAEDAAVARTARRKPAVQLHHELRDDAVLREPGAGGAGCGRPPTFRKRQRTVEGSRSSWGSWCSGSSSSTW